MLYSSEVPEIQNSFNIRDQIEFTGHYEATYSFENEVGLNESEIGFTDHTDTGITCNILENYQGHNAVLNFTSTTNYHAIINHFDFSIINGSVEYWIYRTENNKVSRTNFYDIGSLQFQVIFRDTGQIAYYNGTDFIDLRSYEANQWYHVKVNFDTNVDIANIYVNNIFEVSDTFTDSNSISRFGLSCLTNIPITVYYDGIGYSWDGYNATYSFSDETDGTTGTNIDFVDDITIAISGTATILNNLDNYYKILELYSDSGYVRTYNDFDETQVSGIVELWMRANDTTRYSFLNIGNDFTTHIRTFWVNDVFYWDDNGWKSTGVNVNDNIWYHLKIDFNCVTNTFDLFFDDVKVINQGNFYANTDSLSTLDLSTGSGHEYLTYYDGIGYSWDEYYEIGDNLILYSIGDNIYSQTNETGYVEVDKYEFHLKDIDEFYFDGNDNPSTWTDIEDGDDRVNIHVAGMGEDYKRKVWIHALGSDGNNYVTGLNKDDFGIESGIINITWSIEFDLWEQTSEGDFMVYSFDDTLIVHLMFKFTGGLKRLQYWDGSSFQDLITSLGEDEDYEFNLYIDNSFISLQFSRDGTLEDEWYFPSLDASKEGLNEIKYINDNIIGIGSTDNEIYFDYIGIYVNGSSISLEPTWYFIETIGAGKYWYFNQQKFYSFTGEGTFISYIVEQYYSVGISDITILYDLETHKGNGTLVNVIDFTHQGESYANDPLLLFYIYNATKIINVNITGIKLLEGSNSYSLSLSSSGINVTESYFYLGSEDDLRYTMTMNDSGIEYIEAEASISQPTDSYMITFSQFNSHIYGFSYTKLTYNDDSTTTFVMSDSDTTIGKRFSTSKTITTITIRVSDDNNYDDSTMTGYISNIEFIYTSAVLALVSTTFIAILPVLFILIPLPIYMYNKFDKEPIILMGSFFVLSIVCVITSLIPMWLMFVFILGMIGIILGEDDK